MDSQRYLTSVGPCSRDQNLFNVNPLFVTAHFRDQSNIRMPSIQQVEAIAKRMLG